MFFDSTVLDSGIIGNGADLGEYPSYSYTKEMGRIGKGRQWGWASDDGGRGRLRRWAS